MAGKRKVIAMKKNISTNSKIIYDINVSSLCNE